LAILFNNQGLVKNEFRAGLALVRVVESGVTAIVYYNLGLFVAEIQDTLMVLVSSAVIGIPLGALVIRRLDAETFRRICMSFDAWIVGFGLSRVLIELNLVASPWAYSAMACAIVIDVYLLYIFFTVRRNATARSHPPWTWLTPRERSGLYDPIHAGAVRVPADPFAGIGTVLGYFIAFLALALLVHTVHLSP
jgi:hypothetical protein